jgi:DNA polymerase-3 subunit gamma/tau
VEDRQITEILGVIDRTLLFGASAAILEGSAGTCLEIVDRIYTYGHDIKEFYRALMDQFRNLLMALVAPYDDLLDMVESDREALKAQADKAGKEKLQQILNYLIAREESLRYTSHPRLVLETVMIRLSQMGEVIALDELIRKLESLERKLSSPGTSNDPEPVREAHAKKELPRTIGKDEWDAFVTFVASKNKRMGATLEGFPFLEGSSEAVVIGKSPKRFESGYFDDAERVEELRRCVLQFFKREVRIHFNAPKKGEEPPPPKQAPQAPPQPQSQGVQDVLNMFQGEIRGEVSEDQRRKES